MVEQVLLLSGFACEIRPTAGCLVDAFANRDQTRLCRVLRSSLLYTTKKILIIIMFHFFMGTDNKVIVLFYNMFVM